MTRSCVWLCLAYVQVPRIVVSDDRYEKPGLKPQLLLKDFVRLKALRLIPKCCPFRRAASFEDRIYTLS